MIEILSMAINTDDFIIGWDIEVSLHKEPTAKMFFEKAVLVLSIDAIEHFMDHAMKSNQEVKVTISNSFNSHKQLTFDPFSAPKVLKDDPIALLMEVIDDCIHEFLKNPDKEDYGEEEEC